MSTENAPNGEPNEAPPAPPAVGALSLEGLNSTVPLPPESASFWRQYRAFVGPAFLVSVGYMDPGNWGTDLAGGADYKFDLLWVVAVSSFMAIIMQVCSLRLGIVTGKDLAQACRDHLPAWTRWPNWIACEIAIAACDLAEVLGSAVALNLLFHIPLFFAVCITAFDVLLILALQSLGVRFIEALIATLVATIAGCYFVEIFVLPQTAPNFLEMGSALLTPGFRREGMILGAIGIIGATVMPHNLYLHSALVRTRQILPDESSIRRAIKFNTIDTVLALSLAFFVNASILVLAAVTFHGRTDVTLASGEVVSFQTEGGKEPDWIRVAYLTLTPLLGAGSASVLFAVALLASGQSSTITGTLAGQVVMEGFMRWRMRPWARRLVTRLIAIVPAIFVIGFYGNTSVTDLLKLSQVVLAMQLPLAMFPLLYFTSSRKLMGKYRNGWFLLTVGWVSCLLITALDLYGLPDAMEKAWKVIAGG